MKITNFFNTVITKPGVMILQAGLVFCLPGTPVIQAQTITTGTHLVVGSGSVVSSNNTLSVQSGGTLDVQGTLILKQNLVNQNSSATSLGNGLIELSGSTTQVVSGQNIIQDLRINNTSGGVTISGDTRVNGVLKLKSGVVTLGSNNLLLGPAASDSGGSVASMVDVTGTGEFRKEFASASSFTYPVGNQAGTPQYTPVTASFTGGTFPGGNYLGVTLKNLPDPNTSVASGNYLNRYWNLNNYTIAGTISCGLIFNFPDADVVGTKANLYCVNTSPILQTYNPVSGNQLTGTVSSFGRFTGADFAMQANFKAFLQGPYDFNVNHNMSNTLATGLPLGDRSVLTNFPSNQPYNGTPWSYTGTESVVALPANVIDWVLIELRHAATASAASSGTIFARRAAFLLKDGTIVDLDGSPLKFYHASFTQNLYPVIRHRNHMAIMAANAVTKDGTGNFTYDFSSGSSQVYGGTAGLKQVETSPARWAMVAGDANADNNIWNNDYVNYYVPLFYLSNQYLSADFNMDLNVWNNDYVNYYVPNFYLSNPLP